MVASCIRRIARTGTVIVEQVGMRLRLSDFVRDTRGGATSIVATLVAVMVVAAAALIVDHNWLFGQRDIIKSASDSAAIAATIEMRRPGILDKYETDELKKHLKKVAENYVLLNLTHLSAEQFEEAKGSLEVTVDPDREAKTVRVEVSADLGGTLFSRELPILDNYEGPEQIDVKAAVEGVSNPIEVVLAIDVSGSMGRRLDGEVAKDGDDSRMKIVKGAAQSLVDILGPDKDKRIAVGLVPWHAQVRLEKSMRGEWERSGRAKYPKRRHFGATYKCNPANSCTSLADDQDLPPSPPETWLGCLDEQRVDGTGHAKLPNQAALLNLPSEQNAFAQGIFPAYYGWAYDCFEPSVTDDLEAKKEFGLQLCYGTKSADAHRWVFDNRAAQKFCVTDTPSILPLTVNEENVKKEISKLKRVDGGQTYSALGILWGLRLLEPGWKSVLGAADAAVHPVDPNSENGKGVRKAIVLLTDGEDNQCGSGDRSCSRHKSLGISRETACNLAKEAGIEIFVIAAMDPQEVSKSKGLADALRDCSGRKDDPTGKVNPTGKYVFINNTSKEDLEDAFADIANQLTIFRRVQ